MTPLAANQDSPRQNFTSSTLARILGDLRDLPLLPATAQQAMELAQRPDADLHELCRLLERDVTLAASVLKLVNSPLYNWTGTIASLQTAVIRLGARECQRLILAISMRNV